MQIISHLLYEFRPLWPAFIILPKNFDIFQNSLYLRYNFINNSVLKCLEGRPSIAGLMDIKNSGNSSSNQVKGLKS